MQLLLSASTQLEDPWSDQDDKRAHPPLLPLLMIHPRVFMNFVNRRRGSAHRRDQTKKVNQTPDTGQALNLSFVCSTLNSPPPPNYTHATPVPLDSRLLFPFTSSSRFIHKRARISLASRSQDKHSEIYLGPRRHLYRSSCSLSSLCFPSQGHRLYYLERAQATARKMNVVRLDPASPTEDLRALQEVSGFARTDMGWGGRGSWTYRKLNDVQVNEELMRLAIHGIDGNVDFATIQVRIVVICAFGRDEDELL